MKTQKFQNAYNIAYVKNDNGKIELSINNFIFILDNDVVTNSCEVYESNDDYIDSISGFHFDVNLSVNEYPNDIILDYIVTNLIY